MTKKSGHCARSFTKFAALWSVVALSACGNFVRSDSGHLGPDPSGLHPNGLYGSSSRGYVAGKFMLAIGNNDAGWIMSVEGGQASSEVVAEKIGTDQFGDAGLPNFKIDSFTVKVPLPAPPSIAKWVGESLSGTGTRPDGTIFACDSELKSCIAHEFHSARILEVGFPAADVAAKDPALLTVKFRSALIGDPKSVPPPAGMNEKTFVPSNFRFTIDGVEAAKVTRLDGLTLRNAAGADDNEPRTTLDSPTVKVTMPAEISGSFLKLFQPTVLGDGNVGGKPSESEKTGALEYLTEDLGTSLFTLDFKGLGIFRVNAPDREDDAGSERVTIELSAEEIRPRFDGTCDGGKSCF